MKPAPAAFAGTFSEFFARWVEPNLPSPTRVAEFDAMLRRHLASRAQLHVLRKLPRLVRGVEARTGANHRILPADNSPGWWLHAMLLSDAPLPLDSEAFFAALPTHFFQVAGRDNLNRAGFHLAHILDVGNRDTAWAAWDGSELARRIRLNLHPCNWFLLARPDWARAGGNPAILSWVEQAYRHRYGETFVAFRRDVDRPWQTARTPLDPPYAYDRAAVPSPRPHDVRATLSRPSVCEATMLSRQPGSTRRLNRAHIFSDLLGGGIVLDISTDGRRYILPHDRLVEWVARNMNALATRSWTERGNYSWPRPTAAMRACLEAYRVK